MRLSVLRVKSPASGPNDSMSLFDSALSLMIVRLVVYANAMVACDDEAIQRAELMVKRSIDLAHKHEHDVAKLLDSAVYKVIRDGVSDKMMKYLGFIAYDMKVYGGIINDDDDNISPCT